MGFTRYWRRPRELDEVTFSEFAAACKDVCTSSDQPLSEATFTEEMVSFEGNPGCEPFMIERVSSRRIEREGLVSEFCKTQQLPYDKVVEKCLVLLKDHFPEVEIPRPA